MLLYVLTVGYTVADAHPMHWFVAWYSRGVPGDGEVLPRPRG
jgi:hypothetical protein